MTDVEKSEIPFIMRTIYGILLQFTLFFRKISLLLQYTRYCVEKILAKNSEHGEKMTGMQTTLS